MTTSAAEPERGAVNIPAPDGYHYADDHPWSAADQSALIGVLWDTARDLPESGEDVPVYDATIYEG